MVFRSSLSIIPEYFEPEDSAETLLQKRGGRCQEAQTKKESKLEEADEFGKEEDKS